MFEIVFCGTAEPASANAQLLYFLDFLTSIIESKIVKRIKSKIVDSEMVNPRSLEREGGWSNWPPSIFSALNFCSSTDWQKLWHNCSLFVNTSFYTN